MFSEIVNDIYEVFASAAWTAVGYTAYPYNYSGVIGNPTYVRFNILPANPNISYSGKQIDGMLIISIYVASGNGDEAYMLLADTLDTLFQGKTLTNGTQFGASSLKIVGNDPNNTALYRVDYAINFTKFGDL